MKKEKFISKIDPRFLKGIAHRGLHDDVFTENGINAFKKAIETNTPFEFDVHLTKDNELVVCHDENLIRTTGKEGIIEDLTLKEIKENYTLLDGSKILTLKELLDLNKESVPIVIELKVYRRNYKPLAKKVVEELKDIKDKSKYMLISFDPRALIRVKKLKIVTSLLVTTTHAWVYKLKFLFDSLDLEYVFLKKKKCLRYQKKHFLNVWTIEKEDVLNDVAPKVDTVTFQHLDYKKVEERLKK